MQILIAPNAFKNSLDAAAVAHAIEKGLQQSALTCTTFCFPVADGGDGTGELLTNSLNGIFIQEQVHDPLGRIITASYGLIDNGQTAVIEMASASGIRLLRQDERDPLHATSFGTGELMLKALDRGVKKIILCVGGSATVDGGCGILEALGVQFFNSDNEILTGSPARLSKLAAIDMSGLDKRMMDCDCVILCDVKNTLLGDNGAAKIFGPQKGASVQAVQQLEKALSQFNSVVLRSTGMDMSQLTHGGAAGGTAAGLHALLHAKLVNGIDHFLDMTNFDSALTSADLVITGEGSIDEQTLEGKGPYGVAVRAKNKNIPVIAFAGNTPERSSPGLNKWFNKVVNINNEFTTIEAAIKTTGENLTRTARQLGDDLARQ